MTEEITPSMTPVQPQRLAAEPGALSLGERLRMKAEQHAAKEKAEAIKQMHDAMEEAASVGKLEVTIKSILDDAEERKLWEQGVLTSGAYEANKRSGTRLYWGGDHYKQNMENRRKFYQKNDAKTKRAAKRANQKLSPPGPKP